MAKHRRTWRVAFINHWLILLPVQLININLSINLIDTWWWVYLFSSSSSSFFLFLKKNVIFFSFFRNFSFCLSEIELALHDVSSLSVWLNGATYYHQFDHYSKYSFVENTEILHVLHQTASGAFPVNSRRLLAVGAGNCSPLNVLLKLTAVQTWNICHKNMLFSPPPNTL